LKGLYKSQGGPGYTKRGDKKILNESKMVKRTGELRRAEKITYVIGGLKEKKAKSETVGYGGGKEKFVQLDEYACISCRKMRGGGKAIRPCGCAWVKNLCELKTNQFLASLKEEREEPKSEEV